MRTFGLLILFVVGFVIALKCQTVENPNFVQFTASADHLTLVTRYDIAIFPDSLTTPVATQSLGKPAPDGNNEIKVDIVALLSSLADGTYHAKVIAVGAEGSTPSEPSNYFIMGTITPPQQPQPYTGTAILLPGTIETENYDLGGQAVAYNDSTSGNEGGSYRPNEAVDLEPSSGGGFNVGWTTTGEWVLYSVNVQTSGTYTIDFRVASTIAGLFRLEINGTDVTGPLGMPNTGGWQTWQTVTKTGVNLTAGLQQWKLVMVSADPYGGNFDWIRASIPAPEPPPVETLTAVAKNAKCRITVQDIPPTTQTGWGVQFRFNNAGGTFTNIGSIDSTSPYTRTSTEQVIGTYQVSAVWNRTGSATVIHGPVSVTCNP